MDKNVNYIKGFFTMTFSLLTSLFGVLAIPILLMVGTNIIDYATGLIAAPKRSEDINSYKSMRGIWKKVCMWLLVAGDHRRVNFIRLRNDWHHLTGVFFSRVCSSVLDHL